MTRVETAPKITAGDAVWCRMTEQQREDMRALARAHGRPSRRLKSISYDMVDLPLLRFEIYEESEDGQLFLTCGHRIGEFSVEHLCRIALRVEETALRASLPTWWHPYPEGAE